MRRQEESESWREADAILKKLRKPFIETKEIISSSFFGCVKSHAWPLLGRGQWLSFRELHGVLYSVREGGGDIICVETASAGGR